MCTGVLLWEGSVQVTGRGPRGPPRSITLHVGSSLFRLLGALGQEVPRSSDPRKAEFQSQLCHLLMGGLGEVSQHFLFPLLICGIPSLPWLSGPSEKKTT